MGVGWTELGKGRPEREEGRTESLVAGMAPDQIVRSDEE